MGNSNSGKPSSKDVNKSDRGGSNSQAPKPSDRGSTTGQFSTENRPPPKPPHNPHK